MPDEEAGALASTSEVEASSASAIGPLTAVLCATVAASLLL